MPPQLRRIVFAKTRRKHRVARFVLHRLDSASTAPPNGEGSHGRLSKRSHPAKPLVGARDAAKV
jgi:hypothetical protein